MKGNLFSIIRSLTTGRRRKDWQTYSMKWLNLQRLLHRLWALRQARRITRPMWVEWIKLVVCINIFLMMLMLTSRVLISINWCEQSPTTLSPTLSPSGTPSQTPSSSPSSSPTVSSQPSAHPSLSPSVSPTSSPSLSASPTAAPSISPSVSPTSSPSTSQMPTSSPSVHVSWSAFSRIIKCIPEYTHFSLSPDSWW